MVEAVKAAGLEVLEVNHQGEWVSVTAQKELIIQAESRRKSCSSFL